MRNTSSESADAVADGPLAAQLLSPETFPRFVDDCIALIGDEIRKKGMTLRTAFKVTQKVKPDITERTVRELSPDFVHALEPCYAKYRAEGGEDLRAHLIAHEDEVADAMLIAADRRAERIHNRTIHSAYGRVRGRARREISEAMPQIASVIARHAE